MNTNEQLDRFYNEFLEHVKQQDKQIDHLIVCQQRNAEAISDLHASTKDVVEMYTTLVTTMKTNIGIGVATQKFGLWLLKWPLIGVGLFAMYQWILDHFIQR